MHIPFRIVDVFTDRPLAGNQLCVVPGPISLPDQDMLAITIEMGFSETTFVTEAVGDHYAMRIFTPKGELPFAGHPSLGTAFVLVSEGRVSTPATQVVAAGEVAMSVDLDARTARMRQFPPRFKDEVDRLQDLAEATGLSVDDLHPELPAQLVWTGIDVLVIPARDTGAVSRAAPDPPSMTSLLESVGTDGLYVVARDGDGVRARFFTLGSTVDEDAATGSAAGPCAAYFVEREILPAGRVTIRQGIEMGRPSTLLVDVERAPNGVWEVHVGGGVATVASGAFELPL